MCPSESATKEIRANEAIVSRDQKILFNVLTPALGKRHILKTDGETRGQVVWYMSG